MPDPPRVLYTSRGTEIRVLHYAPLKRQDEHSHARTSITLIVRGSVEERAHSRSHVAGPLSLVVKPAGTIHRDSFGKDGVTSLQINFSPDDPAGRELAAWRWTYSPAAARIMLALLRRAHDETNARAEHRWITGRVQSLVTVLGRAPLERGTAPAWLAEVRQQLRRTERPIRVIARNVDVHPVHLAQTFRRYFGTSPSEHRRRLRARRAASLIADTSRSFAEIALESGFADQAHMTRSLSTRFGITPGGLRRLSTPA